MAPAEHHHYFKGLTNVELHSSINDKSLLRLYQSAQILLLPLLDCTANNALLEGMACGLPVVTTDLPAIKDYVNDDCSILAPKGDSKALAMPLSRYLKTRKNLSNSAQVVGLAP